MVKDAGWDKNPRRSACLASGKDNKGSTLKVTKAESTKVPYFSPFEDALVCHVYVIVTEGLSNQLVLTFGWMSLTSTVDFWKKRILKRSIQESKMKFQ
jgi:hypothetical protein